MYGNFSYASVKRVSLTIQCRRSQYQPLSELTMHTRDNMIWGSLSGDYEECHLLGRRDAVLCGSQTFRRNVQPPSSGQNAVTQLRPLEQILLPWLRPYRRRRHSVCLVGKVMGTDMDLGLRPVRTAAKHSPVPQFPHFIYTALLLSNDQTPRIIKGSPWLLQHRLCTSCSAWVV